MDNKSHIRFINSHSKRIGCYHKTASVIYEIILVRASLLVTQSCMILGHGNASGFEILIHFLHQLPCNAVDNATLALMLLQKAKHLFHLILCRPHFKIQITSVKSRSYDTWIAKLQDSCYIFSDRLRCGSCKSPYYWSSW